VLPAKNVHQLNVKSLKQTLLDFYDGKPVTCAKEIRCDAIEELNRAKWNKLPRRRKDSRTCEMEQAAETS